MPTIRSVYNTLVERESKVKREMTNINSEIEKIDKELMKILDAKKQSYIRQLTEESSNVDYSTFEHMAGDNVIAASILKYKKTLEGQLQYLHNVERKTNEDLDGYIQSIEPLRKEKQQLIENNYNAEPWKDIQKIEEKIKLLDKYPDMKYIYPGSIMDCFDSNTHVLKLNKIKEYRNYLDILKNMYENANWFETKFSGKYKILQDIKKEYDAFNEKYGFSIFTLLDEKNISRRIVDIKQLNRQISHTKDMITSCENTLQRNAFEVSSVTTKIASIEKYFAIIKKDEILKVSEEMTMKSQETQMEINLLERRNHMRALYNNLSSVKKKLSNYVRKTYKGRHSSKYISFNEDSFKKSIDDCCMNTQICMNNLILTDIMTDDVIQSSLESSTFMPDLKVSHSIPDNVDMGHSSLFDGSDFSIPDTSMPDISVPDVSISMPDISMPDISVPDVSISMPDMSSSFDF